VEGVKKISDKREQAAKIELVCRTLFGFWSAGQKWTSESSEPGGVGIAVPGGGILFGCHSSFVVLSASLEFPVKCIY